MRCVLDVSLYILAGRAVKLMTLLSYSLFFLLSHLVPKELFLKAWVHVFDHNVMAKGEMTFTFSQQLLYDQEAPNGNTSGLVTILGMPQFFLFAFCFCLFGWLGFVFWFFSLFLFSYQARTCPNSHLFLSSLKVYSLPNSAKASCKTPSGMESYREISELTKPLPKHVGVYSILHIRREKTTDECVSMSNIQNKNITYRSNQWDATLLN